MSLNRLVVRDLAAVVLAIATTTTVALAVSRASRRPLPTPPTTATVAITSRSPQALGAMLYERKGCAACHSVDGTPRVGPSFLHDYGSQVKLDDGSIVAMDDAYIRESLASPRAKSRPGYPAVMPSYDGLLSRKEQDRLIAYLASLR